MCTFVSDNQVPSNAQIPDKSQQAVVDSSNNAVPQGTNSNVQVGGVDSNQQQNINPLTNQQMSPNVQPLTGSLSETQVDQQVEGNSNIQTNDQNNQMPPNVGQYQQTANQYQATNNQLIPVGSQSETQVGGGQNNLPPNGNVNPAYNAPGNVNAGQINNPSIQTNDPNQQISNQNVQSPQTNDQNQQMGGYQNQPISNQNLPLNNQPQQPVYNPPMGDPNQLPQQQVSQGDVQMPAAAPNVGDQGNVGVQGTDQVLGGDYQAGSEEDNGKCIVS